MRVLTALFLTVAFAANAAAFTSTSIHTVAPGDSHTNNDGVTVNNDAGSGNDITIDPKTGSANSATTVKVKNNAEGSVTGIDANDTVDVAHNATVSVTSSEGGTVDFNSGGSGTVTNTAAPGGPNITIKVGGRTAQVTPGSTLTIT